MLNFNQILTRAGQKYQLVKKAKGIEMLPELQSDQIKVLTEILVEEINREIQELKGNIIKNNKPKGNFVNSERNL